MVPQSSLYELRDNLKIINIDWIIETIFAYMER